jgi:hypothetical protein
MAWWIIGLMLLLGVVWLRCEWHMRQTRALLVQVLHEITQSVSTQRLVQENSNLNRTVLQLSEQHVLLCEIRNSVSRTVRYSRDILVELRICVADSASASSSAMTTTTSENGVTLRRSKSNDQFAQAKAAFRRGSLSESSVGLSVPLFHIVPSPHVKEALH